VRDDQVPPGRCRALEHVQRRHHGYSDAVDLRVWIPRFEGVYCLLLPGNSDMRLNSSDHFTRY
jgi:hypothetical protein